MVWTWGCVLLGIMGLNDVWNFSKLWRVQFENFQIVMSGHKSWNAQASSGDFFSYYKPVLLKQNYSIAVFPQQLSCCTLGPFLHAVTYLCICHWPIRNTILCWVYNNVTNQCWNISWSHHLLSLLSLNFKKCVIISKSSFKILLINLTE